MWLALQWAGQGPGCGEWKQKALCGELAYFSLKLGCWVLEMDGKPWAWRGSRRGSQTLLLTSIACPQSMVLQDLLNGKRNHSDCQLLSPRKNVEGPFRCSLLVGNFLATEP